MRRLEQADGRALLTLKNDGHFFDDVQTVNDAINLAKDVGHVATIDQFWFNELLPFFTIPGQTMKPVDGKLVEVSKNPPTGILSEAAALTVADIEVTRLEHIPVELLSPRERRMKDRLNFELVALSPAKIRSEYAKRMSQFGGIAVIAGNNLALNVTAGFYEDLQSIGR